MKKLTRVWTLDELILAEKIKLGRGNIISKKDIASFPGEYPIYSSAREKNGTFGYYGKYMFDEELITWSIDGGGRLFYRPRHKFSVTNVGGTLRILDPDFLDCRYLHLVLTHLHSKISFDWVYKAHPSVIRMVYNEIPIPSLDQQREIVENLDRTFAEIDLLDAQQKESAEHVGNMLESYIDNLLLSDQDENVPLTNLAILENGDRGSNYPNKNMREHTGIPFINAGHIGEGKLDMSQMDYISRDTFDKLSRGKIQRNDLLFCLRGSLGKTALLNDIDEGAIASSLVIVRAKDAVDPKFLLYYFLSSICKSEIEEFRSGTAQPNLGGADLKKFLVPKHSPRRMQEIVTKIDEMASQVENLAKNNALRIIALGELRQSLLHHAFTQEEAVA
jgi:restriction endonuclease S subunit